MSMLDGTGLELVDYPESFRAPVRAAEVIAIGTELVQGLTVNTNAAWISEQLVRLGVPVTRHVTVGDDLSASVEILRESAARADLLIVTGGLGPTRDDITRDVVAQAAGVKLVLDPKALAHLEEIFRRRINRPMTENNRLQAYVPEGGIGLPNPAGTAPGIATKIGQARVFVFPGVPRELMAMFGHVDHFISQLVRPPGFIRIRLLHCFGTGESDVGHRLADLMDADDNPVLSMTVSDYVVTVKLTARSESRSQVDELVAAREQVVRQRLSDLVFGVDGESLAEVVGRMLIQKRLTLAAAESCTGGWLTESLTEVSGISQVLMEGVVSYSDRSKVKRLGVAPELIERHGAVSEEVAAAMARGVRAGLGTDIGIGITGIAGPTGGSPEKPVGLVCIATDSRLGAEAKRYQFFGNRQSIRRRATLTALNLLRFLAPRLV